MKKFVITEEEKNRILGMHIGATSRQYLKEDLNSSMTTIDRYNYNSAIQCFLNKKGVKDDAGQPLKWGEDTMDAMPEKDKVIFKQCVSDYGDLYDKIIHYFGWD